MTGSTSDPGEAGTRTVSIVGLGISGRAAAAMLKQRGYRTVGFDQKTPDPGALADTLDAIVTDPDPAALAARILREDPQFVVVSPGIPESSDLIRVPRNAGIKVIGEVQLAWDLSESQVRTLWLTVTGTNGKTTTVGMLETILRADGMRAAAVGNVGYPITTAAFDDLDVMAVELSSFQLAGATGLQPVASICLNVDSDHLDWHGDRESYVQAKARVYDGTRLARFFFRDEPETRAMAEGATDAQGSRLVPLTFGSVPRGGIGVKNGRILDRSGIVWGGDQELADLSQIALLSAASGTSGGSEDAMVRDALAAAALARAVGVKPEAIEHGLSSFKPDEHRREDIGTFDGVRWVNDSKATNVHAAISAARTLTPGTVVWIIGGDAKGQDLRPLVHTVGAVAKAAVLIGAGTDELERLLDKESPDLPRTVIKAGPSAAGLMEETARACADFASSGDTVLLAPGCASWDQFASYAERGELFRRAVKEMYAAKGK